MKNNLLPQSSNNPEQPYSEIVSTVHFYDLDPMQVVWHGNYLKYFETARTALFDKFDIDLYSGDTGYVFPVIRSTVKHLHPLRHRDRFRCRAELAATSIKIVVNFEIRLLNGTLCAKGSTEQAAVKIPEMQLQYAIPPEIKAKLSKLSLRKND